MSTDTPRTFEVQLRCPRPRAWDGRPTAPNQQWHIDRLAADPERLLPGVLELAMSRMTARLRCRVDVYPPASGGRDPGTAPAVAARYAERWMLEYLRQCHCDVADEVPGPVRLTITEVPADEPADEPEHQKCICGHGMVSHSGADWSCTMCVVNGVLGCLTFRRSADA